VRPHTKATASLTGALLVAVLGGAACADGGSRDRAGAGPAQQADQAGPGRVASEADGDGFCAGARELYEQFTQSDVTDPTSTEARQAFARAQELEPPPEIAEAWDQSLSVLEPLISGDIDVNDPAQVAQLGERAAAIDGASLETYFAQECPIN
jgi:hypothetical protein